MGQANGGICSGERCSGENGEMNLKQFTIQNPSADWMGDYQITGKNRKIKISRAGMSLVEKPTETILGIIHKFDPNNQKLAVILDLRERKHYKTAKDKLIELIYEIFGDQHLRDLFFRAVNDPALAVDIDNNDDRYSDVSILSQIPTPQGKKEFHFPNSAQVNVLNPLSEEGQQFLYQSRHVDQRNSFKSPSNNNQQNRGGSPAQYYSSPLREREHRKFEQQSKITTQFTSSPQKSQYTNNSQNQSKNNFQEQQKQWLRNDSPSYEPSNMLQQIKTNYQQQSDIQNTKKNGQQQITDPTSIPEFRDSQFKIKTDRSAHNSYQNLQENGYKRECNENNNSHNNSEMYNGQQENQYNQQQANNNNYVQNASHQLTQSLKSNSKGKNTGSNQNIDSSSKLHYNQEQYSVPKKNMQQTYPQQQSQNNISNNTQVIASKSFSNLNNTNMQNISTCSVRTNQKLESNNSIKMGNLEQLERSLKVYSQNNLQIVENEPHYQQQEVYEKKPQQKFPLDIQKIVPSSNDQLFLHSSRSTGRQNGEDLMQLLQKSSRRENYKQQQIPQESFRINPEKKQSALGKFIKISNQLMTQNNFLSAIQKFNHPYLEKLDNRPYVDCWRYYDKGQKQMVYVKKYNVKMGQIPLINYQTELTVLEGLQDYEEDKQPVGPHILSHNPDTLTIKYLGGLCTLQEYALELNMLGKRFTESELLYILMQLLYFITDMQDDYQFYHGDIKPQSIALVNTQFHDRKYQLKLIEFECCIPTDEPEGYPMYTTTNYCDNTLRKYRETDSIENSEMYSVAKTILNLNNFNGDHLRQNSPEQIYEEAKKIEANTVCLGEILLQMLKISSNQGNFEVKQLLNRFLDEDIGIPKIDCIEDQYHILETINKKRINQELKLVEQTFECIDKELFKTEIHFCTQTQNYERGVSFLDQILHYNQIYEHPEQKLKLSYFQKCYNVTLRIFCNEYNDIEEHKHFIVQSLDNYSQCLQEFEFFQEALQVQQTSLKKKKEYFGGSLNLHVANTYTDIGNLLMKTEYTQQALSYFKEALGIKLKIFEDMPHPSIAQSLDNVAEAYYKTGQAKEAFRHAQDACWIMKKIFISGNPLGNQDDNGEGANILYADYLHRYAFCLQALGRPVQAMTIHNQALDIKHQSCLDANALSILDSEAKLIEAHQLNLGTRDIQTTVNELISLKDRIQHKILNNNPILLLPNILTNLGAIYFKQKKYAEAMEQLQEALFCYQKIHKENSVESLMLYFWLAQTSVQIRDYEKAKTYIDKFLQFQVIINPLFRLFKQAMDLNSKITVNFSLQSSKIKEQASHDISMNQVMVLFNQAISKKDSEQFEEALNYLEESRQMCQRLNQLDLERNQIYQKIQIDIKNLQQKQFQNRQGKEKFGHLYKSVYLPGRTHTPPQRSPNNQVYKSVNNNRSSSYDNLLTNSQIQQKNLYGSNTSSVVKNNNRQNPFFPTKSQNNPANIFIQSNKPQSFSNTNLLKPPSQQQMINERAQQDKFKQQTLKQAKQLTGWERQDTNKTAQFNSQSQKNPYY